MDAHVSKLRSIMAKQNIDAVLISSIANITYVTGYDGFSPVEREAYLLATKNKAFLIVSALHFEEAKKIAKNVEVLERNIKRPLKNILEDLIKKYQIKKCGIESESFTVSEYNFLFPLFVKIQPADLTSLRIIKTTNEINLIRKACELGDKAYSYILKNMKIGMTEKEVGLELEWFIRKTGSDISFPPIVAFEENAAVPHHNVSNRRLKNNNLILLDFGTKVDNYCSDMTRVFFLGKATKEQKIVYKTVVDAQKKATNYINDKLAKNEKAICTKIDAKARDYIVDLGYPPFNHSSHGIGLEVHENPHISSSKKPLENGTVFSIEPGIYLPNKFGVRIEDLFALANNKLIRLTRSPKNLIEI